MHAPHHQGRGKPRSVTEAPSIDIWAVSLVNTPIEERGTHRHRWNGVTPATPKSTKGQLPIGDGDPPDDDGRGHSCTSPSTQGHTP